MRRRAEYLGNETYIYIKEQQLPVINAARRRLPTVYTIPSVRLVCKKALRATAATNNYIYKTIL